MVMGSIRKVEAIMNVYVEELGDGTELLHSFVSTGDRRVTELVRCKDCKHRNTIFCFKDEQGFGTDDDWFCADGKKR